MDVYLFFKHRENSLSSSRNQIILELRFHSLYISFQLFILLESVFYLIAKISNFFIWSYQNGLKLFPFLFFPVYLFLKLLKVKGGLEWVL